jgi:hypothetical protein
MDRGQPRHVGRDGRIVQREAEGGRLDRHQRANSVGKPPR